MNRIVKTIYIASLMLCLATTLASSLFAQQKGGDLRPLAIQYLADYEPLLEKTSDPNKKVYLLINLAPAALSAGEFEKANLYALDLLKRGATNNKSWTYGIAIHVGNLVLGRIALMSGDVNKAKQYLIEAGKTPGAPHLSTFGPNMLLAKELLEKGEREVVIEYFELCAKFWEMKGDKLELWRSVVLQGGVPDFGANLLYDLETWRAGR